MATANIDLKDAVLQRAATLQMYERNLQDKVSAQIEAHEAALQKAVASGKDAKALAAMSEERYKRIHEATKAGLIDVTVNQLTYMGQTLAKVLSPAWLMEYPSKRVAENVVTDTPLYNNAVLADGWRGVSVAERKRLEGVLRKGIADGLSLEEMALQVRKDNVVSISLHQARGLVTTAVTAVTNKADSLVYDANAAALSGWTFAATLDSRTSSQCAALSGTTYAIGNYKYLPPLHFHCRSRGVPQVKSWADLGKLTNVARVRHENLKGFTKKQIEYFDGQSGLDETYDTWLRRQPKAVQLQHLGDYTKLALFQSNQLSLDKFSADGKQLTLQELRAITPSIDGAPGDTLRFANAKQRLDAMHIWARSPDDFIGDAKLTDTLRAYYELQTRDLDGTLSLTNFRGVLIGNKAAMKRRVLLSPPTEEQTRFNAVTGRYEDTRRYQPCPEVLENRLRLVRDSTELLDKDKAYIADFADSLADTMSVNERAAVVDNLRITFGRARSGKEQWGNFKAVAQSQIKFDVINVSEAVEAQIRKGTDVLKRIDSDNYIDPVLGVVELQKLHDDLIPNILAKNYWEDSTAPKMARKLRGRSFLRDVMMPKLAKDVAMLSDPKLPAATKLTVIMSRRLSEQELHQFYMRFVKRLAVGDTPDRDQLAITLGRDIYNSANLNGTRDDWYKVGLAFLESNECKGLYEIESFGVQKRRMKSRLSGAYFGPYYDTMSYNIRVTDPDIQRYTKLCRAVEVGQRVAVTDPKNRLIVREGYKTYFIDRGLLGLEDTRLPIISTTGFRDFPVEFMEKSIVDAMNWAGQTEYRIDEDYYDFTRQLLSFVDDKGKAAHYEEANEYRKFIAGRGDSYERFKAMEWLRNSGKSFSNSAFIDHRGRIYDRGMISPQSGETFRPFLNTKEAKYFTSEDHLNFKDQVGAFLGGLTDKLEGRYNSLTITGRQRIAEMHHAEMVRIGNAMMRKKPADIRSILDSPLVAHIDGEDIGKFYRMALETAKIDAHLNKTVDLKLGVKDELLKEADADKYIDGYLSKGQDGRKLFTIGADEGVIGVANMPGNWVKISGVYLKDTARGNGLADMAIAQAVGKKKSFAFVEPSNKASAALFKRLGYNISGTRTKDGVVYDLWERPAGRDMREQLINSYKTALALEQDASSSGAQIIAMTTKNKQLAEMSNVVPTTQKRRLYDEIAAATFDDPRFKELNTRLGLTEKDLRKAAKAQNMVTFYGAGERTGILNVEGKLGKILGKQAGTLVVKASERDAILSEISAQAARYTYSAPDVEEQLKILRSNVRDIFNKGEQPGQEIMDQLHFLDTNTRAVLEKMSRNYDRVVTPADFQAIATIMSDHLEQKVPILKDFTRFFGRLAEDFMLNAKPSDAAWDWTSIMKIAVRGGPDGTYKLPRAFCELIGIKPGQSLSETMLKRLAFYNPLSNLADAIYGVDAPDNRKTGKKILKLEIAQLIKLTEFEVLFANKLPKRWTNVPWVNFDGSTIEQTFTQTFEERLVYRDKDGNPVNNIVQVKQKTEATWWEEIINKDGKINDIGDVTKARTAFAVNGNHSNDATIVKNFHLWGKQNGIATSTIHDAFFANAADMLKGRDALRGIYAKTLDSNSIMKTLDEMRARGLPEELYNSYRNEAIEKGLVPVVGKSRIGGKLVTEADVLTKEDILAPVDSGFKNDRGWYGVG